MLKGVYTFPDKSQVPVHYNPDLDSADYVYVEWVSGGVKHTCWLPAKGLRYKI
jgi:hypothetical protein